MLPNLENYNQEVRNFSWEKQMKNFAGPELGLGLNIAFECVDRHADSLIGEKNALLFINKNLEPKNFSFRELKRLSSKFANVLLKLGIRKGDRVFSLLGRIPELYFTAFGTLKNRAIFCPLFSVFGPDPISQRINRGEASILVTTINQYEKKIKPYEERFSKIKYIILTDGEKHLSENILAFDLLMREVSDDFLISITDPEDPALLHFTSGTTGMPKGALHIHKALLTHFTTGKYVLDFHSEDIYWCTADPGWVTGTSYGIIAPLAHGITTIVDEEEFDAVRWMRLLEKFKVSIWYTSPTAIRRLMRLDIIPKNEYDFRNLRMILSVGEPLHAGAVLWAQEAFGVPVLDNWWQTETGGIMISNFLNSTVKPGSMGKPVPGIQAEIAEIKDGKLKIITDAETPGQLVLKTGFPSQFKTYLHEEERYSRCFNGDWYITGDLAKKDAEGYFWFIGRADDIIKTSGHMVGPFEVESTLMKHPLVAEAAVIGKPEASIGELVKAFIVLKNHDKADEGLKLDLMGFARKELGPAVAPKEIEFVETIPKTRSGKILRRLMKARDLGLPEGDISTLE